MDYLDKLLADYGAVLTDTHLVFTNGDHGSAYINFRVFADKPIILNRFARDLAKQIFSKGLHTGDPLPIFIGPETLGRDLARLVALNCHDLVMPGARSQFEFQSIFPLIEDQCGEKVAKFRDNLEFAQHVPGRRFIYVDDIFNNSSTFDAVKYLIESLGGTIFAACAVVNRQPARNTAEALGVEHLIALKDVNFESFPPDKCPLCAAWRKTAG